MENSAELGSYFLKELSAIKSPLISEVRGKGLFIGVEIDSSKATARQVCLQLIADGLLTKDTHGTVIRLCPPLVITREQIDDALKIIKHSLAQVERAVA